MVRQKVEESVPVQEVKTPALFSVKHFSKSVLIVLLSFFCIFIGVLIYQLSMPVEDLKSLEEKPMLVRRTPLKNTQAERTSVVFQHSPKSEVSLKKEEVPVTPVLDLDTTKPDKENKETSLPPPSDAVVAVSEETSEPLLTLENALQLRDHLAMGQSCLEDLKLIMKTRPPQSVEKDRLIEKLMPICTARSVFSGLEDTFYKNRKKALMTYYRLNNPLWLAYLKTLGASLVDIRKLDPSKEKPKDIISMAQNALMTKNLKETIQIIQKLPPEIQAEFNDFVEQAQAYLAAQEEAENLILAFGRKGA